MNGSSVVLPFARGAELGDRTGRRACVGDIKGRPNSNAIMSSRHPASAHVGDDVGGSSASYIQHHYHGPCGFRLRGSDPLSLAHVGSDSVACRFGATGWRMLSACSRPDTDAKPAVEERADICAPSWRIRTWSAIVPKQRQFIRRLPVQTARSRNRHRDGCLPFYHWSSSSSIDDPASSIREALFRKLRACPSPSAAAPLKCSSHEAFSRSRPPVPLLPGIVQGNRTIDGALAFLRQRFAAAIFLAAFLFGADYSRCPSWLAAETGVLGCVCTSRWYLLLRSRAGWFRR